MKLTITLAQPFWGETVWDLDGYVTCLRGADLRSAARRYGIAFTTKTKVGWIRQEIRKHYHQEAILAEIEAWQAENPYCSGLMFGVRDIDFNALMALWSAGRIVSGSRTSGPGHKFGWYSVRMIDADHATALEMDAAHV